MFEQFCPKAGDANPLVAEPETDLNAKWPFKVIQGADDYDRAIFPIFRLY